MQTKEMQIIQNAIDRILDMADDESAPCEGRATSKTNEITDKSIAVKRVRHYLFRLQESLAVIKKEVQAICEPTDLGFRDWEEVVLASAKTIGKMTDNLILKEGK